METVLAGGRGAAGTGRRGGTPPHEPAAKSPLDVEGMVERVVALAARHGVEAPPAPVRIGSRGGWACRTREGGVAATNP